MHIRGADNPAAKNPEDPRFSSKNKKRKNRKRKVYSESKKKRKRRNRRKCLMERE